jgi:hypothetical protein
MFTKTYDGIIKGFTKTIDDLRALAVKNAEKDAKKTEVINVLREECNALAMEGGKAIATADKLAALLE